MKVLSRFTALLLIMALSMSFVSCGYNEDVAARISKHLAKEYPGKTFAIIDYEKHNETSGRYEINARCLDDGIVFKMYMYSSIAVTDSYSVERANAAMKEIVTETLGKTISDKLKKVTWHDVYADKATNYRFRELEHDKEFVLEDMESVYSVEIAEDLREAEIGGVIYDFMYKLCRSEGTCNLGTAKFVFKVNRVKYSFTTNSDAVLDLGRDGLIFYILTNLTEYSSSRREVVLEYLGESAEEATEDIKKTQNAD